MIRWLHACVVAAASSSSSIEKNATAMFYHVTDREHVPAILDQRYLFTGLIVARVDSVER